MPSDEAEGVVLRQYDLAEADRIIILFTRERGKMRLVAAGAKRPKSRFGACLEPLTHVSVHYYQREGSELARVRQCETIHSYLGKKTGPDLFFSFHYFAELVQELVQDNQPSPVFFRLLLAVMNAGEKLGAHDSLLRYFEIWALRISGFLPDYEYCSSCSKCVKDEGFYLQAETGQGHCRSCAGGRRGPHIRPEAASCLTALQQQSPEQYVARSVRAQAGRDLERLAQMLLALHLEKNLKSYMHLSRLSQNS